MAVTLSLFAGVGAQLLDNNGVPLSGGKIFTYLAGTTTPQPTYTTNNGNIAHTNPIVLDSAGRVPSGGQIWLINGIGYKFIVKTSTDVLIATYDNVPSSSQQAAANDADSIFYEQGYSVTAGSFVVGRTYRILSLGNTDFTLIGATSNTVGLHFTATGVGVGTGTAEVSQSVETKFKETISVKDFGAVGDGVADDTAAFQAALAVGGNIYIPDGTYLVTDTLTVSLATRIYGGKGATIKYSYATSALFLNASTSPIAYFEADGFTVETTFTRAVMSSVGTFQIEGATSVSITDLYIYGGNIRLEGATFTIVERNRLSNSNAVGSTNCEYGIVTFSCFNATISDNMVGGYSNDGIKIGVSTANTPTATLSSKTVVANNKVYDSVANHIDIFDGGRNCVVTGNILYGTCTTALEIKSQSTTPGNFGDPGAWPNATNSERVVVSDNNVSGTLTNGVVVYGRYYDINHNIIADATSRGVVVGSFNDATDEPYVSDIGIVGNTFINNGTGVFVRLTKKGVRINDNAFVGKTDNTKVNTGITLAGKNQVTITSNSFKNLNYAINSTTTDSTEMMVSITGNIINNANFGMFFFTPTADAKVTMIGNSAQDVTTPVGTNDGVDISRAYTQYANSWQPSNNVQLQTVGNVGTSETDLLSYTLPAGALNQVFQSLQITVWGQTTSSSNAKTIRLYFGSQAILTTALTASQASSFRIVAQVFRTGGNTQTYTSQLLQGGTTQIVDVERGNPTQTDTSAIVIKSTATVGGTGANSDLTVNGMTVTAVPF